MLPILLILTAAFAVLTWSDLHKGLFLLVAVLPSYLLRTELFGVPTTILEMLLVAFVVVWILRRHFPIPLLFKEGLEVVTGDVHILNEIFFIHSYGANRTKFFNQGRQYLDDIVDVLLGR